MSDNSSTSNSLVADGVAFTLAGVSTIACIVSFTVKNVVRRGKKGVNVSLHFLQCWEFCYITRCGRSSSLDWCFIIIIITIGFVFI